MGNILITGGTGFLGKPFVRELAENTDSEIFVLARPPKTEGEIKAQLDVLYKENVHVLLGDIIHPEVLMDGGPQFSEIWHLAGSTDFQENRREQTTKLNISGVRNMIALGRKHEVEKFYHVSTAYVAGVHHGKVYEDELVKSPDFRNVYEETKYQGEILVRNSGLNFVILRPSIIMGHSETGEVDSDKMVYGVVKLFHKVHQGVKKFFGGKLPDDGKYFIKAKMSATKNLITVDDVISLMFAVRDRGQIGKTYHLCNPESTTINRLYENISSVTGVDYIRVQTEYEPHEEVGQAHIERGIGLYDRYINEPDPDFDLSNLSQVMNGHNIKAFDDGFQQFLYKKYLEQKYPDQVSNT